ncbi:MULTISPECIES: 5-deoxy-glucuronate isomerase [unclassified Streptomyces]|uniref:5-deoxy-glucuronate isomerase n=1 Tax=unclassified Streptomyces TaxID=2593676 RepID=UPI00081F0E59|nr:MULTISPECIES: 5-deoxy-glucuronate isomerase [unclassified Streptomyces]SCD86483.1 5-deoxyglucuronate isomerase [Streptomyces sp. TverLS-915]SCE70522.1 5-deoxyglucuronate isomerase [Streptomyces sp. LcepLS]
MDGSDSRTGAPRRSGGEARVPAPPPPPRPLLTSPHIRAGTAVTIPFALDVSPARTPLLRHTALRVLELPPGARHVLVTGAYEWLVVPLAGGGTVRVDGEEFALRGRSSVFGAVSDFAYLPRDARAEISSGAGGRFALAGATCGRRLPARYGPAPEVPVELRGAGRAGRQVNNLAQAGGFACDRLMVVEVLTPAGNWSSYPPHKHDEAVPGRESELEEIYYFELSDPHGPGDAYGLQRVSASRAGGTEVFAEVRPGDVVLIPDGWHGPSVAPPERHLYYLNVMAGPGPSREWLITDHPAHEGVRDTWAGLAQDPRLPLTSAEERA